MPDIAAGDALGLVVGLAHDRVERLAVPRGRRPRKPFGNHSSGPSRRVRVRRRQRASRSPGAAINGRYCPKVAVGRFVRFEYLGKLGTQRARKAGDEGPLSADRRAPVRVKSGFEAWVGPPPRPRGGVKFPETLLGVRRFLWPFSTEARFQNRTPNAFGNASGGNPNSPAPSPMFGFIRSLTDPAQWSA
jgi:hypothetical protein